MSNSADSFDDSERICSAGMKLRWDINDPKLPRAIEQYDAFQEWTDGYVRLIYNSEDKNAQRHLSGWAMRNTNNHNCQILKKSCLGVVVCGKNCTPAIGSKILLRPAICDKARQKQQKKFCPSCGSPLELTPCRGHSGYPVTNLWRLEGKAVFFQAKGMHDHPRPESKSEAEARRTALKRKMLSPLCTQKKKLLESQARRFPHVGGPILKGSSPECSHLVENASPKQLQPYSFFQGMDPYRFSHDTSVSTAEPVFPMQKSSSHHLCVPCLPYGYEFAMSSSLGSHVPLCKETCSASMDEGDYRKAGAGLTLTLNGAAPLSQPDCSFTLPGKHQLALSKVGHAEQGDYVRTPSGSNHNHDNCEYLCRNHGATSGTATPQAGNPTLQAVITTTTKVSYQQCNATIVMYGDNFYDVKSATSCDSLRKVHSPAFYPDVRIPEDSGVVKSAIPYEPESLKLECGESLQANGCASTSSYNYSEYSHQQRQSPRSYISLNYDQINDIY